MTWELVIHPARARPGTSGVRRRGLDHGGVSRSPTPDPSAPPATRSVAEQKFEDARAEAHSDLVRAWFSTSRHGARLTFARLRRMNAYLTPEALKSIGVSKTAAGFKLAEPPTDAERIMHKEGLI